MRRTLGRILLIGLCLGALALLWIFGGRQIALAVDRLGTAQVETVPITELSYEPGGNLRFGTTLLSITGPNDRPVPLGLAPDVNNKLILTLAGKTFPLGDLLPAAPDSVAAFGVQPDQGDQVSITVRRSFLNWPTPFDFNFMTGHAPSWKRHLYRRLVWKKQSGTTLDLLWRHEQYFYPNEGWTAAHMTHPGTTGLIRATIKP